MIYIVATNTNDEQLKAEKLAEVKQGNLIRGRGVWRGESEPIVMFMGTREEALEQGKNQDYILELDDKKQVMIINVRTHETAYLGQWFEVPKWQAEQSEGYTYVNGKYYKAMMFNKY